MAYEGGGDLWSRQTVVLASGATRSADINITGYSGGSVLLPTALRGAVRWRGRHADTGASGRIYDETNTAVLQQVHPYTKPMLMAIHPRVMSSARLIKLCVSTAPTGPKTLDVFLKY